MTLIAIAVAGLGAAAYLLIDNWESISARWRQLWGDLKVEAIEVLNAIIDKINVLIRLWNSIPAVPDVGEIGRVTPPSRGTMSPEIAALDAAIREAWVVPDQQSPEPGNLLGSVAGWLGNIPGFAAGGIVTGPTLARIGEAGPEAVVPLDKLGKGGSGRGPDGAGLHGRQHHPDGGDDFAEQWTVDAMVDRADPARGSPGIGVEDVATVTVNLGNAIVLGSRIIWAQNVDIGSTFDADGLGQELSQTDIYFSGGNAGLIALSISGPEQPIYPCLRGIWAPHLRGQRR